MILALTYAENLQDFLEKKIESGVIQKFKIFMRIGFQLDAYIFTTNCQLLQNIENEFYEFLQKREIYLTNPKKTKIYFNILPLSELDDSYYSNIVNDPNTIDLGPRYRFDSILEDDGSNKDNSLPPVTTFYSYKGGVGRTTCMISYAMHLAKMGKKVVVIDCDLEAPGYLNFFNLSENPKLKEGKTNGIVEFICDTQFAGIDVDIKKYFIQIGEENDDDSENKNYIQNHPELKNIWLVPAGNLNESLDESAFSDNRDHYLEGLSKLNLGNTQTVIDGFSQLFLLLQKEIKCDVILVDSRTGFNDIFGTAALHLSKCVIGFFGYSRQNDPGFVNLLMKNRHCKTPFKLMLAYSILPENEQESSPSLMRMQSVINRIYDDKEIPPHFLIHRDPDLEKIGTVNIKNDEQFINKLFSTQEEDQFSDYIPLFKELDECLWPPKHAEARNQEITKKFDYTEKASLPLEISESTPALKLRNIILRHLKNTLADVKNFAEDSTINEKNFFYRECMKKIFSKENFLIQGYKGTGKTYLYRALKDDNISKRLQKWAGVNNEIKYIFINILAPSKDEPSFPFKTISYSKIEEPEYYFNCFWQIYTWNKLLIDDGNSDKDLKNIRELIKNKSKLSHEILPVDGQEAKNRFNRLIKDDNTLLHIEEDLKVFNEELKKKNIVIIALYDRLDTYINPLHWNKAVSPLIDYWQNYSTYSNIFPKIFVRTDLFKQIEGTNTARLSNNIINIEWTIEEVFAYFFKLIFTDEIASKAYWYIAKKNHINDQYISSTQKVFTENNNQFKSLKRAEMDPVVYMFFGKMVQGRFGPLGKPWDYFGKELANADNKSISLRPFINTLDKNAVDKALSITVPYVHEIISSEIYASKEVRDFATNQYFDDLARDEFSKDLYKFKDVIRTAGGDRFRFKSLNETDFENLMNETFRRIGDSSSSVKSVTDLKNLIFANGIMAETITAHGRFYNFASIYWYSWGLANGPLEIGNKFKHVSSKLIKPNKVTVQPPLKAMVYKPDQEILARIKKSQEQAQTTGYSKLQARIKRERLKDANDNNEMPF